MHVAQDEKVTAYATCIDKIYELRQAVTKLDLGKNQQANGVAYKKFEKAQSRIEGLGKGVQKTLSKTEDAADRQRLQKAYSDLQTLSKNKVHCVKTISELNQLEAYCNNLSSEIDGKAVLLAKAANTAHREAAGDQAPGFLSQGVQDCIVGTRQGWEWVVALAECNQLHARNGAAYHTFFHELYETRNCMRNDLDACLDKAKMRPEPQASLSSGKQVLLEIQATNSVVSQWAARANALYRSSVTIPPINLRRDPCDHELPARALVEYKTEGFAVQQDEDLLLIDKGNNNAWTVKNSRGEQGSIPAVCCILAGHSENAVTQANELRVQFLDFYIQILRALSVKVMKFLLLILKETYSNDEMQTLYSLKEPNKTELLKVLLLTEDTMADHWKAHPAMRVLLARIQTLRMVLYEKRKDQPPNNDSYKNVVLQTALLDKLMTEYQKPWTLFAQYKSEVDVSQYPESMLVADQWQKMQFFSTNDFYKIWLENVKVNELVILKEEDLPMERPVVEEIPMEQVVMNGTLESAPPPLPSPAKLVEVRPPKEEVITEMEQTSLSEQEESRKFVIRSVIDPSSGEEISLQEAIARGVIDPNEGNYVNEKTKERIPIPEAMDKGLIHIEFQTTQLSAEKTSTFGIINVTIERAAERMVTITSVLDTEQDVPVPLSEALRKGIIDQTNEKFIDKAKGKEMSLEQAISLGLVTCEEDEVEKAPSSVEMLTYMIELVTDRRRNKRVQFAEAMDMGLLSKETAMYHDNVIDEWLTLDVAIERSYIQGKRLSESELKKLNLKPEQRVSVKVDESSSWSKLKQNVGSGLKKLKESIPKPKGSHDSKSEPKSRATTVK